jgi:hypothetical protein
MFPLFNKKVSAGTAAQAEKICYCITFSANQFFFCSSALRTPHKYIFTTQKNLETFHKIIYMEDGGYSQR